MYEYNVKIVKVVDGDTVDVDIDLGFGMVYKKQRVRMVGIDTPESRTRDKVEKQFCLILSFLLPVLHRSISLPVTPSLRLTGSPLPVTFLESFFLSVASPATFSESIFQNLTATFE